MVAQLVDGFEEDGTGETGCLSSAYCTFSTFCVSVTASSLRHFILALKSGACGIAEFAPISDGG